MSPQDAADLIDLARRFQRLPNKLQQQTVRPVAANGKPAAPQGGDVVSLQGVAVACEKIATVSDEPAYRVRLLLQPAGTAVQMITPSAPAGWLDMSDSPLEQPASCTGVVVGANDKWLLVVTPRVRWTPTVADGELVSYGQALLGTAGVDISLLDEFIDARPLSAAESEPFYRLLSGCKTFAPAQLIRAAGEVLPRYTKSWKAKLASGNQRRLAAAVVKETGEGRYSVAPLFNDPLDQRGELIALEGLVRRAVRIDLSLDRQGKPSRVPERYNIDHYYEIELFPPDSQNLPMVFCVLDLPDGFPTGDTVDVHARVAGFFLKRWAYRTRKQSDTAIGEDHRQLAPLLVSSGLVWLPEPTAPSYFVEQAVAGLVFLGVMATIVALLRWQAIADRKFEQTTLSKYSGLVQNAGALSTNSATTPVPADPPTTAPTPTDSGPREC